MEKEILTFEEAIRFTGLSKSHLYKLTSSRRISHFKPHGKLIYFTKSDLEKFLLQNRVSTSDELENKAQAYCMSNKKGGNR